jgi:hypothetical protein
VLLEASPLQLHELVEGVVLRLRLPYSPRFGEGRLSELRHYGVSGSCSR